MKKKLGTPGNTWEYLGIPGNTWEHLGTPGNTWEHLGKLSQPFSAILSPSQSFSAFLSPSQSPPPKKKSGTLKRESQNRELVIINCLREIKVGNCTLE